MAPATPILRLSVELLWDICELLPSFSDVHNFSMACNGLHDIVTCGKFSIYSAILKRDNPAYEDALRVVRAAATAFDWLAEMKYDDNIYWRDSYPRDLFAGFEQSEEFKKKSRDRVPRCYFDLEKNEFVGVPTKKMLEELGTKMLSDDWEVRSLMSLLEFSKCIVHKAKMAPELNWETAGLWTHVHEARMFRGVYKTLLWGYLFAPGIYIKPLAEMQENLNTGKSSLAWANALVLKVKHPSYRERDGSGDHCKVYAGFMGWVIASGEKEEGGLWELVTLHTACGFLYDVLEQKDDWPVPQTEPWILCTGQRNGLLDYRICRVQHPQRSPPWRVSLSVVTYSESLSEVRKYLLRNCENDRRDFPANLCPGAGFSPYCYYDLAFAHDPYHYPYWLMYLVPVPGGNLAGN
ncbi:hypothetical protein K505DRAFT_335623 [Melanomma pulvis-pyrius CBS 109.77]|uniref:Uncharacterized protein n=1 Tax=Melanomma pulvis-pyrius CBS 109.77 TaxID=1314802 RepID=A0A6A6XHC5_9PLEO|nr:hypothetical protein K505DRAFT_335623 [Melanomma pulvis-pyrius CBS 109.77]